MKKLVKALQAFPPTPGIIRQVEGRHFIAQSELLTPGGRTYAWGGVFNPPNSGVNLVVDRLTFTNFSPTPFTGRIYINSSPPGKKIPTKLVASSNATPLRVPPPQPKATFKFNPRVNRFPKGGNYLFTRRIKPNETEVVDDSETSVYIVAPGGSMLGFFISEIRSVITRSVIGWWEVPIRRG
ncbi:DUF6143 family protein [Marininema halotolerans]|uniref:Uncharacterized protein n=1 Tax=Marininema halotolerans TaxID=1155944 RepID=A0A1I6S8R7_9BACL|nr:DUF6143 family protein [Marininema halotolerans]SFS73294.1 hypothetical protein SAMN05444972_106221 [Marininema halotolerans]